VGTRKKAHDKEANKQAQVHDSGRQKKERSTPPLPPPPPTHTLLQKKKTVTIKRRGKTVEEERRRLTYMYVLICMYLYTCVCALLKNSNKGNSASVKKAESTWFARKEQRGRGTEAHFFFFLLVRLGHPATERQ
jgi:hypothetical protein